MADPPPVHELDAELASCPLVSRTNWSSSSAEHAVEGGHLGDGRLAHADDADLATVALDQRDLRIIGAEDAGEGGGGHPAGGAPAAGSKPRG